MADEGGVEGRSGDVKAGVPVEPVIEPRFNDSLPDYDHEPVFAENWQPEER